MIPGTSRTTKRRDFGNLADNNIGWVDPVIRVGVTERSREKLAYPESPVRTAPITTLVQ